MHDHLSTDKKENKIFLIYKEIQMGGVVKSYMRKGLLIYEEMRKYLVIYEEVFMTLQSLPSEFHIHMRKILFSFYQCGAAAAVEIAQQWW